MSKTINDSNIDLNKFPASKVRQLAKKMESSKAAAKHIKQVANKPQATQVHFMRHQCTELPLSKFQRKQNKSFKSRQAINKHCQEDKQRERMPQEHIRKYSNHQANASHEKYPNDDRCHKCGDPKHIRGFQYSACKYQCSNCHKSGHFSSLCYKKQEAYRKRPRSPKA